MHLGRGGDLGRGGELARGGDLGRSHGRDGELRRGTDLGAVLLTVGRSYVGNDVTYSTLLDRACACSYENLSKYRSYRVSNTAPWEGK